MTKNAESFFDFTQLSVVDMKALEESHRKTVEAFGAANWAAFEGAQKIFRRQAEMVQESLSGMFPGFGELATAATPGDAAATQARLCKGAYEKAAADGRELVDLVTKSSRAVTAPIQKRIVESLDEIKFQADKLDA